MAEDEPRKIYRAQGAHYGLLSVVTLLQNIQRELEEERNSENR